MVTITDKAKDKIEELMRDTGLDESYFLRVSVKGGGCSGLSYNMDFDNETQKGTELDFSDGLNGKGFNFINPNASRTCGCGESFSV